MDVKTAARSLATVAAALALAATAAMPARAVPDAPTGSSDHASPSADISAVYNWHLAPSLSVLRSEVNARWPHRDRSSDGAIGDARHRARTNSHNPARYPGGPGVGTPGSVHALDITARGINVGVLLDAVVGDPRVWYVIHDGRIWSRTTAWAPRVHRGDPHTTHIHINLREDSHRVAVAAERDTSRWLRASGSSGVWRPGPGGPAPVLSTAAVKALQRSLISRGYRIPSGPTGWYGPETTRAVAAFQRAQGWTGSAADGIAGPQTLRLLGVSTSGGSTGGSTAPPASPPGPTAYRPGTTGPEVRLLQKALIKRGYSIRSGATGYYGPQTLKAVRAFQLAQGWPASQCDGIPGPLTLRRLGLA